MGVIERKIKDNNYIILHINYKGIIYYDRIHHTRCDCDEGDGWSITGLKTLLEIAKR